MITERGTKLQIRNSFRLVFRLGGRVKTMAAPEVSR
jgi:hypothetical protein